MFRFRLTHDGKGYGPRPRGVVAVALLCLGLLALLAVAQAVHTHTNPTDADHCQLCITMHTVVPTAIAMVALILVELAQTPVVLGVRAAIRQLHPQPFIRPPPVGC